MDNFDLKKYLAESRLLNESITLTPEEKSKLIYFLDMEIIKAASDRSINTDPVKTILNKLK